MGGGKGSRNRKLFGLGARRAGGRRFTASHLHAALLISDANDGRYLPGRKTVCDDFDGQTPLFLAAANRSREEFDPAVFFARPSAARMR